MEGNKEEIYPKVHGQLPSLIPSVDRSAGIHCHPLESATQMIWPQGNFFSLLGSPLLNSTGQKEVMGGPGQKVKFPSCFI